MKIIRCFFLFVILMFSSGLYSQNSKQAKICLDKATAIINNKEGLQVYFSISKSDIGGGTSGNLAIKGNKFMAITPLVSVWFDGKTQWAYTKSTNEVSVFNPTEAQRLSINPYSFINIYKNGYMLSMTITGNQKVIHMLAQNKKRSVSEAYITLSMSNQLKQVKMRKGGKWTIIKIIRIKTKKLNDAIFKFNKKLYPKAEIVDMR